MRKLNVVLFGVGCLELFLVLGSFIFFATQQGYNNFNYTAFFDTFVPYILVVLIYGNLAFTNPSNKTVRLVLHVLGILLLIGGTAFIISGFYIFKYGFVT